MAKSTTSHFVLTPVARLFFPHITKPKANRQGVEKFGVTLAIPRDEDISELKAAAADVAKRAFPDAAEGWRPKSPFRDGDQPNGKGKIQDGFPGNIIIGASSNYAPAMADQNARRILDGSIFYPGCYVIAQINFYSYEGENSGVTAGLQAIQFVRDGERVGGGAADPSQIFKPVATGESASTSSPDDAGIWD